jgi:GH43 family beta-xylosidase
MSNDIWAPEVHWLDNRWYIYFTATNDAPERDPHRRIYVLESVNTDIFGDYVLRGQLRPTDADEYAIRRQHLPSQRAQVLPLVRKGVLCRWTTEHLHRAHG